MLIQVASDLHLEFFKRKGEQSLIDSFKGEADVLVLAGDITLLKFVDQVRDVFTPFCDKYKHVVYVPGNHEYYGTDPDTAHLILGAVQNEIYNLHVLKNNSIELDGQKFYGGSLWFPYRVRDKYIEHQLNDFNLIKNFKPWVYHQSQKFLEGADAIDENTIVVSHHLPSYDSVAEQYRGSALNSFFVNDVAHLIHNKKPKLWIHGHTHTPCDYVLAQTRVVCNPRGYPLEGSNSTFNSDLIIDTKCIISPGKVV